MVEELVTLADGRVIAFPETPRRNEGLEVWREHLDALLALSSDAPYLHKAIEVAELTIREKERVRAAHRKHESDLNAQDVLRRGPTRCQSLRASWQRPA
jgi:hypothetical protein